MHLFLNTLAIACRSASTQACHKRTSAWEGCMHIFRRGSAALAFVVLASMAPAQSQAPSAQEAQQPATQPQQGVPKTTLPPIVVAPPAKKPPRKTTAKTPASAPAVESSPPATEWTPVVRTSPVGGSELALDKVPAGITIVTGAQIDRVATPSLDLSISSSSRRRRSRRSSAACSSRICA